MQKELDDYIFQNNDIKQSEIINKEVLALLVELGEFANEYRAFKYWSKDQEPRNKSNCTACYDGYVLGSTACKRCNGSGFVNPLLEEFIDVLHFTVSLENYYGSYSGGFGAIVQRTTEIQLKELFHTISALNIKKQDNEKKMSYIRAHVIGLIEMMNFSIKDVKKAYISKYEVNKLRQENNY